MNLAATEWLPGAAAPWMIGLWIFGGLVFTGGLGFLAGALIFSFSSGERWKKSLAAPGNLMPIVRKQLDAALEAAKALRERPEVPLSEDETAELLGQRDHLLTLLTEIVELQKEVAAAMPGKPRAASSGSGPFEILWVREPLDSLTKLPTAGALAHNLRAMLAKGADAEGTCGFLFIKLDGFEKLLSRVGSEARDALFKKFVSVVIRAVREVDLVCRYNADTLAVLFPSIEEGEGPKLAHTIRKSLLDYQFRVSESGQVVILNAHFGYTDCRAHEDDDLILNRAETALAKSQSRGSNQMHAHDGEAMRQLRRSYFTSE
jgi:diguanylate cyclase (GGDEF)-like protein